MFAALLEGLTSAGVRFVVIGGVAAGLHGSVRVTLDLDICYDPAAENRQRLARLLTRWKAYPRGVEPGFPFTADERLLANAPVLTLTTAVGDLDLMDRVTGVGEFEEVLRRSVEIEAGGLRFRILDLPALLANKRATRRPKDLDQIPELEALLELRRRSAE